MTLRRLHGRFRVRHFRHGELVQEFEVPNAIQIAGRVYLLETALDGRAQETDWYMGLFNDDGSGGQDDDLSTVTWTENTSYDESTRPAWDPEPIVGGDVETAMSVEFTINATVELRGVFIVSDNTKGGTTGVLWAIASFQPGVIPLQCLVAGSGSVIAIDYSLETVSLF